MRPPGSVSLFPTWMNSRFVRYGPGRTLIEGNGIGNKLTDEGNTWWGSQGEHLFILGEILIRIYNGIAGFKLGYEALVDLFPCPL